MGRVFFNTLKRIQNVTADYTVDVQESGTTFIVLPAATTAITLPTPGSGTANAGEGWHCTIILQSDSGFGGDELMDALVNIDLGADTNNVGNIHGSDGVTGVAAVDTMDWITCALDASPGDTFEFLSDGTRWFINGFVFDASTTVFATDAAS